MKWRVAFLDQNGAPITVAGGVWVLSRDTREAAREAGRAWQSILSDVHGIRVEKRA